VGITVGTIEEQLQFPLCAFPCKFVIEGD
jgi:hypothetical protein